MVVVNGVHRRQSGFGLLELMLAVVVGAIVLLSLQNVIGLATKAGAEGHASNELAFQGRFAFERMVDKAQAQPQKQLTGTPAAGTTGNWLAPSGCSNSTCTMYCRNASSGQLIETVTSDTSCSGGTVIARNVTAFSAVLPTGMGPLDRHAVVLNLTLADGQGHTSTLSAQVRLGGGTQ